MLKLVVIGTVLAVSMAEKLHPIREDLVNEIKQKASTWTPMEVSENPLSNRSKDELFGLLGMRLDVPTGAVESDYEESIVSLNRPKDFDPREDDKKQKHIH
jgi:hypothetical protein